MGTPLFQRSKLGSLLLEQGLVTPEVLKTSLAVALETERRLGEVLLEHGAITEEALARALAEQHGLPFFSLSDYQIPQSLLARFPIDLLDQHRVVPYLPAPSPARPAGGEARRAGQNARGPLTLVLASPQSLVAVDVLEARLGEPLAVALSTPGAVARVLKQSAGAGQVLQGASRDLEGAEGSDVTLEDDLSVARLSQEASPMVKLVHALIFDALAKQASDIHLETGPAGVAVKYRIDGVLYPVTRPLDRQHHQAVVSRIKVMAELDIAESRVPQDGRFTLRRDGKAIDFRVSVLPGSHGEDVVIRILDKEAITAGIQELRLDRLGFGESDLAGLRRAIREPYGMVLVTGPTGSGKTTTLYAALTEIHTGESKIVTIEDPVEYQLRDMVQVPVNEKKGLTFARGLRSILRHDPDIIMVGEIRDPDTAQIAVQSALTGHLVFTTVHANNAFDVIGRFHHMGIEPYNFVSALNCILAQRLVRLLCPACKAPVEPGEEELSVSGLTPQEIKGRTLYEPRGCAECHNVGYRGRSAITEFLDLSDRIREMILEKRSSSRLRRIALEEGMTTLRQSALEKVFTGLTTLREINRVTFVE